MTHIHCVRPNIIHKLEDEELEDEELEELEELEDEELEELKELEDEEEGTMPLPPLSPVVRS